MLHLGLYKSDSNEASKMNKINNILFAYTNSEIYTKKR